MATHTVNLSSIEPLAEEAANLEFLKDTDEGKQHLWERMGEQLEIQNYPKKEISKKIHEIIEFHLRKIYKEKGLPESEAKFKSGHFYRIMSKNNWTDKDFVRNETEMLPEGDNTNASHVKLSEDSEFYDERYEDIILIQKQKKFLSMIEYELEKNFDEIKNEDTQQIEFVKRDWSLFYDKERIEFHDFMKNLFANYFDEWSRQLSTKQSLLPKMWIISASIMGCGVGISDFCNNYYALVKNKTKISTKAWRKFMTEVNNFSDYMHFIQDDAWKWSVLPIPCPQCKKKTLRTKLSPNGTWDFVCTNKKAHKDEIQPHFTPNLFRQVLKRYMNNTSKIGQAVVDDVGITIITNEPEVN